MASFLFSSRKTEDCDIKISFKAINLDSLLLRGFFCTKKFCFNEFKKK